MRRGTERAREGSTSSSSIPFLPNRFSPRNVKTKPPSLLHTEREGESYKYPGQFVDLQAAAVVSSGKIVKTFNQTRQASIIHTHGLGMGRDCRNTTGANLGWVALTFFGN